MNRHRQVLARLIDEIVAYDPGCSIMLGGSLAREEEREDSDIDLFVWLSWEPGEGTYTDLFHRSNRLRYYVCAERGGIEIDIGWNLLATLSQEIPDDVEIVYYPFVLYKLLRDPSGKVARWWAETKRWVDNNPWIAQVWGAQYHDMCQHKKNPAYPLRYDEKEWHQRLDQLVAKRRELGRGDFEAYIRQLMGEREEYLSQHPAALYSEPSTRSPRG